MTPAMATAFIALAFSFLCLYLSFCFMRGSPSVSCVFCSLEVLKYRSLQIHLPRLCRFAVFSIQPVFHSLDDAHLDEGRQGLGRLGSLVSF